MDEVSRLRALAIVLLIAWVIPSGNSSRAKSAGTAITADNLSDSCPVTHPPSRAFIPPSPYPSKPDDSNAFWFGTKKLWTVLDPGGTWRLQGSDSGFTNKLFWWREDYDWRAEPQPQLIITGRRLDASAPPLRASRASNGYRKQDWKSFMVVGVDVPTAGCWEITGRYGSDELKFVVRVEAQ